VSPEDDRTVMIGQRTRVALEREKLLVLRSIKELEFDRAMGRLSDEDFHEMAGRLRTRAGRLIQQLDAGVGYREQIEKDLAKRMGAGSDDARLTASRSTDIPSGSDIASGSASLSHDARSASLSGERVCASCETRNDGDARFCKGCGQPLAAR
jgi:hypothetical protein